MDYDVDNYPIGGFFELELRKKEKFIHSDGILLSSCRNALEYVLRSLGDIRHLWIPFYTCEVILAPLTKLNIGYSFYHIDECLEIKDAITLKDGEYLLYINYFGIKDNYTILLSKKYGSRLIVDNAQSWFSDPIESESTIYSPRKFVGIPDGGVAYCKTKVEDVVYDQDYSCDRFSHLIKRIDLGPSNAYRDFKENGQKLFDLPIRRMSTLTHSLLSSIDFEWIKNRRIANFNYLHQVLKNKNKFIVPDISTIKCPMVYPYLSDTALLKKRLIENKIFVATYWPNVLQWCSPEDWEYTFASNACFLPIDQRYGEKEMNRIVEIIINQ